MIHYGRRTFLKLNRIIGNIDYVKINWINDNRKL